MLRLHLTLQAPRLAAAVTIEIFLAGLAWPFSEDFLWPFAGQSACRTVPLCRPNAGKQYCPFDLRMTISIPELRGNSHDACFITAGISPNRDDQPYGYMAPDKPA